jgi:hypothetical protein
VAKETASGFVVGGNSDVKAAVPVATLIKSLTFDHNRCIITHYIPVNQLFKINPGKFMKQYLEKGIF